MIWEIGFFGRHNPYDGRNTYLSLTPRSAAADKPLR
jgi:hypothetical protein